MCDVGYDVTAWPGSFGTLPSSWRVVSGVIE